MRRIAARAAISIAALGGVLVPGQALAGGHAAATRTVVIKNYAFSPAKLSIHRGDSVRWLFRDGTIVHNVIARRFRSSPALTSGSFTVRFTRRGTFAYTCTIHPWMTGSVAVH